MSRISTFDDWIDLFRNWQNGLGLEPKMVEEYKFEALFGDLHADEIEFGDMKGRRKFEKLLEIPDQRMRDALLNLIVYQGDTEFGSVEQQRNLVNTSPSEHDLRTLVRVMREEMRHGWQMCHLLVEHFGTSGRVEAVKMLERSADQQQRLLGSFNVKVDHWLDFFVYTEFIDRDGKFQLTMLSHSSFAPLARSMPPMLKEEAFHLGTGHNGLKRVLRANRIPIHLIQKYINKWVPTAYDLFGTDHSSSAEWSYVWGLKGRFDEHETHASPDRDNLNEHARDLYVKEIAGLFSQLNSILPEDSPELTVPSVKFNRSIGGDAHQPYDIHGERLSPEQWEEYAKTAFPTEDDIKAVNAVCKDPDWITPKA
ncbi:MAG: phenylacetate-CoA oxygenase subunit PaaI [candidate division Zixibacteria bacterium]|nr:phenylacetate-CoA oxygenase subunit PaaI [candidate division Zixibacteria bacterium]